MKLLVELVSDQGRLGLCSAAAGAPRLTSDDANWAHWGHPCDSLCPFFWHSDASKVSFPADWECGWDLMGGGQTHLPLQVHHGCNKRPLHTCSLPPPTAHQPTSAGVRAAEGGPGSSGRDGAATADCRRV